MDITLDHNLNSNPKPTELSPLMERLLQGGAEGQGGVGRGPGGFAGLLSKGVAGTKDEKGNAAPVESAEDADQKSRFRDAARELVGITFVLPILKMVRQDPFKGDLFHGGQGEEMFGARMDEMLADRIASRMDTGLGDAIYRKFTGEGSLGGGLDQHG